ncbi:BZ3500_MvSof-1268-A1-R1_Chr1-3g02330 [Microbotryum saponariae]|uniref:D-aminoacyl-tRNA deacylase n=1 Tax=Microbotryum saponariae TaxID=289078 RepID=A0A2X0LAQ2_9BASI|nr:BZ3500_MvSof-1268-A1-R1_Chr1-3g02330 [Microbotryum saponariae]SCZ96011.1 BZ3501_MvSof-1269-A2-R1_Chr1-3g01933 [Microbotryum saponariae]
MKAVVQRCRSASVTVDGQIISSIQRGLMVLVGIGTNDTIHESQWLVNKLLNLRFFPEGDNDEWGWKKSVMDIGGEILSVSQFTLMAVTKKGSKPDFHGAMAASQSKAMYDTFLTDLRTKYQHDKIKDGQFGAMMDVQLINDGPATIILDSIDAPAPVIPKPYLTPEQKRLRKEQLAKEEAEKKAAAQDRKPLSTTEVAPTTDESLTQKFKESMMEIY